MRATNVADVHVLAQDTRAIARTPSDFGYPVCIVCGQSVSPLSSASQLEHFRKSHWERCGRKVSATGFYADVVADALTLPGCPDQKTAYSVLEALRMAATQVLDMTLEDLQVLVLGHVDRDEVDAVLWDPMPGGSGLLDQICGRFTEMCWFGVIRKKAAIELVGDGKGNRVNDGHCAVDVDRLGTASSSLSPFASDMGE